MSFQFPGMWEKEKVNPRLDKLLTHFSKKGHENKETKEKHNIVCHCHVPQTVGIQCLLRLKNSPWSMQNWNKITPSTVFKYINVYLYIPKWKDRKRSNRSTERSLNLYYKRTMCLVHFTINERKIWLLRHKLARVKRVDEENKKGTTTFYCAWLKMKTLNNYFAVLETHSKLIRMCYP